MIAALILAASSFLPGPAIWGLYEDEWESQIEYHTHQGVNWTGFPKDWVIREFGSIWPDEGEDWENCAQQLDPDSPWVCTQSGGEADLCLLGMTFIPPGSGFQYYAIFSSECDGEFPCVTAPSWDLDQSHKWYRGTVASSSDDDIL